MTEEIESFYIALYELEKLAVDNPWLEGLHRMMAAHMCHECNYGKSVLATLYNNFCGMQFRNAVAMLPGVYIAHYEDWRKSKDKNPDIGVDEPEQFAAVYLAFLHRWPYNKFGHTVESFRNSPLGFISHLARCGYAGSTPGVYRKDYATNEAYATAVHVNYAARNLELYLQSPKIFSFRTYLTECSFTMSRNRVGGSPCQSHAHLLKQILLLMTRKLGNPQTTLASMRMDHVKPCTGRHLDA